MIKNYLKIALRNLWRHKAYSAINIFGLAIGMACSILIFLWVRNEMSYDRFHDNANKLYRITAEASQFKVAINPAGMPPGLKQQMPEIKEFVRTTTPATTLFQVGDKKFEEKRVFYVDSPFLKVFSFKLLKGERSSALQRIDAVLITKSAAKKYFGDEDPMGKTIRRNNKDNVIVTGVLEDVPANSHLQFDVIMPMIAIAQVNSDIKNDVWDDFDFYSYLLLNEGFQPTEANIQKFEEQMDVIYAKKVPSIKVKFQLQPLTKIHLHSNLQIDLAGHGNIQYVRIFLVVAIFILIVACINFMNLATARSARRAKEVGLRKVVGAGRGQLIAQFLGESMLIAFFALLISIAIVLLSLPMFNYVAGKAISFRFLDGYFLVGLISIAILVGAISGSYPALFLSAFQPVKVLKGNMKKMGTNLWFRNGLVVIQFVVSIMLLVGTVVVYQQLRFIKNRNLGYSKEHLLYIPMMGEIWSKQQALKTELAANPLTSEFAITSDVPTNLASGTVNIDWEGKDPKSQVIFPVLQVDESFIDVFKIKLVAGRSLSKDFKSDSSNYVLNETAVKEMGFTNESVIGKRFSLWDQKGIVIGVVKDFHFKPVQQPIEPLILRLNTWGGIIVVRTKPNTTKQSIKALEKIYSNLNPAYPFSYNFLDQDLDNLYKGEQQLGSLFNIFAALAIFISCMGLYGLSAFMAEQRTKEIGVRKVLGASVASIVYLLSTNITRLILLATVIAIPLSWWAIYNWLQNFAYHIQLSWIIFAVASFSALLIAWITVSFESIKAAIMKPASSLKTD